MACANITAHLPWPRKEMNRKFIAANDLLLDSFQLAANICRAGFRPDFLVGLWRGGSAVGIAVQEGLDYFGIKTDHIGIRTSYTGLSDYSNMVDKADAIRVHGLQYLLENLCNEHSLLIVDDVYSTGSSVSAVIETLSRKTRRNLPHEIRIATVWYRPSERTIREPDFFVHKTSDWLILPYELSGLTLDELRHNKPEISGIVDRLRPFIDARDSKPAA
jgi:hypoxanthine phosphoribosyltransferase